MTVVATPLEGLAQAHKIAILVEVIIEGQVEGELLDTSNADNPAQVVTSGSVTYDANAAFRGRLECQIASEQLAPIIPTDQLAPYATELRVSRGLYIAGVPYLNPLGIFKIERATTDGVISTISANDRAMIVSEAKLEEPITFTAGTQATDAIQELILTAYPAATFDFLDFDVPLPTLLCDEGEDPWEDALGIAKACGCQLYFNDDGECALRLVPTSLSGNPVATIAEGEGGSLLSASKDIDRAPIFNRWTVTGENSDEDDVYRAVAEDTNPLSPTHVLGPFGRKSDKWTSEYISSNEQAETAAAGLLARTTGAPDIVSFTALVDPIRRPWDVVTIERERLGVAQDHCLDAVSIPLTRDGAMSASTRSTLEVDL